MSSETPAPPRKPRRRWKRVALLIAIHLAVLVLVFLVVEVGLRAYRLGGLGLAFASLIEERPLATGPADHWIVHDDVLGYRFNTDDPKINELGFFGPEVAEPKPADVFRLLAIGDSVGYSPEGFLTILRERAHEASQGRVEIWNACVPGYTSHQESLYLGRIVDRVQPDLVLVQYCLNDNHEFLHLIGEGGAFLITHEARDALAGSGDSILDRIARWSYLVSETRRFLYRRSRSQAEREKAWPWLASPEFAPAWREESWQRIVDPAYERIAKTLATREIPWFVVAAPYEPQLAPERLRRDAAETRLPQTRLARLCARLDVPLFDLFDILAPRVEEKLYEDGIHFTPHGHVLVADALWSWLQVKKLLPTEPR
ncbi:MAG: hypothetical protein H6834_18305 [Planctomycetes bacterium]|nr:hypothetical protein [Planctomycetota bacterium]MCB9892236.1 hypothetical protein [Planctomycetota bacterium]